MWMNTSKRQSMRPASSTSTLLAGSADSRFASAQPADPPPTMTNVWAAATMCIPSRHTPPGCADGGNVPLCRAAPKEARQAVAALASRSPISAVEPGCAASRPARSAATAASTRAAASSSPRWASSIDTDSTAAVGSALP